MVLNRESEMQPKEANYLLKLEKQIFVDVRDVITELVSEEIKSAFIIIGGVDVSAFELHNEPRYKIISGAQLVSASKIAEDALAAQGINIKRMVIDVDSEDASISKIIIQKAGTSTFVVAEAKEIIPGQLSCLISGDGKMGGTLTRINEAVEKIKTIFETTNIKNG